jgi:hypothetical protein
MEASFPLHFLVDRLLREGASAEAPEHDATDKPALHRQWTQEVKEEYHPLVGGAVLHRVWVGIIKKQQAAFLPGAS